MDTSLAPTSVLAFLTTLHLALVVLRAHRSATASHASFVSAVSVLFSGSPWLLPSSMGLAAGFAAHVAWFAACERFLTMPVPAVPPAPPAAPPPGVVQMARQPREPKVAVAAPARQPSAFVPTHVVAVFDETPDIRTFRMARPEGFEFKAGQFLTGPAPRRRHASMFAAIPSAHRRGRAATSRSPSSAWAWCRARCTRRCGRGRCCTCAHRPGRSSIRPTTIGRWCSSPAAWASRRCMSMLRHAIEEEPTRPAALFYSVRTVNDIAFRDEILMLNRRHTQFRAFIADQRWRGLARVSSRAGSTKRSSPRWCPTSATPSA